MTKFYPRLKAFEPIFHDEKSKQEMPDDLPSENHEYWDALITAKFPGMKIF